MRRKTSDIPTRVFSYGCLAPTKGAERVETQIRAAHHYRNVLTEIERGRRVRVQEAMKSVGDVGALAARASEISAELATACLALKSKRSGSGRRADTSAESARVRDLRAQLRMAWTALREEKDRIKSDAALRHTLQSIENEANAEAREARAQCRVYWGTYLLVEKSLEQARRFASPPRFAPFDGSGRVAVQIQGGMSVEQLFGEMDTRLQIRPIADDAFKQSRNRRRVATRTVVRIRVGTDDDRAPLWAELPLIMHRPLPADARIKWAWIQRRRVGPSFRYKLQLVVESETFRSPLIPRGTGIVAVDVGWRNKPDGTVRVGYWADEAGRRDEVLTPRRTIADLQRVDELRATRDDQFNSIRTKLTEWVRDQPILPDWFSERVQYLDRWRSPRKLVGLIEFWSRRRINGDEGIFGELEVWRSKDRRLYRSEANLRERRLGHRRQEYELFAVGLARRYAVIVMADFDVRGLMSQMAPEDGMPGEGRDQRRTLRVAAPGTLRLAIRNAAQKYGAAVVIVDSTYSTTSCHACGVVDDWDSRREIEHTCAHCGTSWDQDYNACMNLLARGKALPSSSSNVSDKLAR